VSEFYRSKANADGYDGRCKACDAIQCSERRKKKPRIENPTVDRKARRSWSHAHNFKLESGTPLAVGCHFIA
jgi:hypothetical protein